MVIRMRHTRAHTRNRRSHHALKEASLVKCEQCGAMRRGHHMCLSCGFYKGRQVLDLATAKTARDLRIKEKHDRIRTESGVQTAPTRENDEKETTEEVKEEVKAKASRKSPRGRKTDEGTASRSKEEN